MPSVCLFSQFSCLTLSHFFFGEDATMAIRQRKWFWKGQERKAWVLEYRDGAGKRRLKTFRTKRDAIDYGATARVDIKHGTHVADAESLTVRAAGMLWLATERS